MRSHPGITAKFFAALAAAGVNIEMISTSEIRISVIVDEAQVDAAVAGHPHRVRPRRRRGRGRRLRRDRSMTPPGLHVGVVGATGQVGVAMRQILLERGFPVDEIRFFASARSAGTVLPFGDREITVEDADDRRPDRARHRAVLRRRDHLAGAGAAVRRRRRRSWSTTPRPGGWTPTSRWWSPRSTPAAIARAPARASSPTRTAPRWPRCRCSSRCTTRPGWSGWSPRPTRRSPAAGVAGVDELADQVAAAGDKARELAYDGAAVDVPGAGEVRRARSPTTCCRWPARSSTTALDETDEEQKLRNESRKILGIPDLRVSGICVRVPVFTGHSLSINAEFAAAADRRSAPARCSPTRPGVELTDVPTPLQAAGQDPSYVGRIRQDPGVDGDRGLALFVSNDNLRKGAALNTVQIAELVAASRRV